MRSVPDRIVVIGGGISGLSSAFYLRREAERTGRPIQVTVVEAAGRLGGKLNTLRRDGFTIERGPDSFLSRKLPIIELSKELGIEGELAPQNATGKKSYILREGKLHPMPKGLVLGIPTELDAFLASELVSEEGKRRALEDLDMPGAAPEGDESLGGFLSRRLGPEIVGTISEPLLAGIYAGDLSKLSIQATFPQFAAAEREHGSLIRGTQYQQAHKAPQPVPAGIQDEIRESAFLSYKGGLGTLVQALERALAGADIRLGQKVSAIRKREAGGEDHHPGEASRYKVELAGGETIPADGIVVTAPAYHAADLLEGLADVSELRAVTYVSVANVVMAFEKEGFGLDFDGSGFLVPRSEGLTITACTWTSNKWQHTSPDDKVLLRCYVGRSGAEEAVTLPDDRLTAAVREDIRKTMGITAEPLFTEITRLPRSMPQYPVGHLDNLKRLRDRLAGELPGVIATGAAFEGVGLPDCIRQGKDAAIKLLAAL